MDDPLQEIPVQSKNNINSFKCTVPFLYPLKNQKTKGFLTCSGGIKMEHWVKMGK